jgi:hypothetical protein
MEIDITTLLEIDAFDLSHSIAEGGPDARRNTWKASVAMAEELQPPILDTPEKLEAMREFALSSGGWDAEEVAEWSDVEVNALFLQWIAGDTRECPRALEGFDITERTPGEWWLEGDNSWRGPYETRSEAYRAYDGNRIHTADALNEIDWPETEAMQHEGVISSNLFRADDGRIFFYLGR